MLSIVLSIHNRSKLFKRGLWTLFNQSLPKKDYEVIVIDDMGTENTFGIMEEYVGKMRMQYIRIDHTNYHIPIFGHTPALSNNVGFKQSRGEIILIAQPEIMHDYKNLEYFIEGANKNFFMHGNMYASDLNFVYALDRDIKDEWRKKSFDAWLQLPGSSGDAPLNYEANQQLYWFAASVKKDFVMKIGGVDEEYLRGVYAEDDNFRERLRMVGAKPERDRRIRFIHQSHADEHLGDKSSKDRSGAKWDEGARINRTRYGEFLRKPIMIANVNQDWGSPTIIRKEIMDF